MQGQAIVKASAVDPDLLAEFFRHQGLTTDIRWKYFDEKFGGGHNRGYAALSDGKIAGFIGLIPFRAKAGSKSLDSAWTCDWYIDSELAGGATGIMLLKQAIAACPSVYHVGGNEITEKVYSRLASHYDAGGIKEYRLALRLGGLLRRAQVRVPAAAMLSRTVLSRIRIARLADVPRDSGIEEFDGVAESFSEVLAVQSPESSYHPVYDQAYLDWQIGRCPDLTAFTIVHRPGLAALAWYKGKPDSDWRVAIAYQSDRAGELPVLLDALAKLAVEKGAESIKVRVSRHSEALIRALLERGYDETRRFPFFAFHDRPEDFPADSMSGLGYLDADMASI
ncbi:MAG: hypothetical protein KJO56_02665 [Gammaproteobacteria bacterium]|nr:hypothetical protein [Gammaproteobacteria bacterium]